MSSANTARRSSEHLAGGAFLGGDAIACRLCRDDSNTSLAADGTLAKTRPRVGLRFFAA
jgi:hypothetical protein